MSGDHTPCAVHALVEEIENGTVMVKPYEGNLGWLEGTKPPPVDRIYWHLADVRRDGPAIARAHKFDFSNWRHEKVYLSDVLYETGRDMVNSQIAALPYPEVVFCQRVETEHEGALEELLLIREQRGKGPAGFSIRTYNRCVGVDHWFFCGYTAWFRYADTATEFETDWIADPIKSLPADFLAQYPNFAAQYVGHHTAFFLSALAALSSKGPEIRVRPAPEKLNKQRAKKGKPPLFEYRIVEIPAWAKAKAEGLGGTHASPRLHWRRGHERRLGEDRKTFVHACLVGVAENGFIHKDYAVAPATPD